MICKKCGTAIPEGKYYCPKCGSEVQIVPDYNEEEDFLTDIFTEQEENKEAGPAQKTDEIQTADEKQITAEEQDPQPDDGEKSENSDTEHVQSNKSKRGKRKKRFLILGVILALALLLALVLFIAAAETRYRKQRQQYNSYDYQIQQGQQAEADKNYEEALSYYSRALELDHFDLNVRFMIAGVYEEEKETGKAEDTYLDIINQDPDNTDAYACLISLYEKDENYDAITELSSTSNAEAIKALFAPYQVTEPVFSLQEGVYQRYIEIEIQSSDASEIFYTIDGSDPEDDGIAYRKPLELDEEGTFVIRAVSRNSKNIYSDVVSAAYTIEIPAPDTPVVSPSGGDFATETKIYIDIPENCIAYYTWDGSDPAADSDTYDGNLWIPEGNNVLSVILIDSLTGKTSPVFRTHYTYYENSSETIESE